MATRLPRYRMKDGLTRLGEGYFNPIWADLDNRLDTLERIKVDWDHQITLLRDLGLSRIDEHIRPVVDEVNGLLQQATEDTNGLAQQLVNDHLQPIVDNANALLQQVQDDTDTLAQDLVDDHIQPKVDQANALLQQAQQDAAALADLLDNFATTDSREDPATTTLLQAKAMADHVESGDHDGRYYRKTEVDEALKTTTKIGEVVISPENAVRDGYLKMDGSIYLSSSYPELVDVLPFMQDVHVNFGFKDIAQDANRLYIVSSADLYVIEKSDFSLVAKLLDADNCQGPVAVDSTYIYVAIGSSPYIRIINKSDFSVEASPPTLSTSNVVQLAADDVNVYARLGTSPWIEAFVKGTWASVGAIPTGIASTGEAKADGTHLYLAGSDSPYLERIQISDFTVVGTYNQSSMQYPRDMVIDDNYVYLASTNTNHIKVFDKNLTPVHSSEGPAEWGSGYANYVCQNDTHFFMFSANIGILKVEKGTWIETYLGTLPAPFNQLYGLANYMAADNNWLYLSVDKRGVGILAANVSDLADYHVVSATGEFTVPLWTPPTQAQEDGFVYTVRAE